VTQAEAARVPEQSPHRTLLAVENLEVRYGATQVLWGISLNVVEGEVTCIIGSNGAGKTTTLNTIMGVLPVKAGKLRLRDDEITALPSKERVRRRITLVPEGRALWPGMSVEDNLRMGCFLPELRRHVNDGLERVYRLFPRLKERRKQLAGTLSGGEQQMCAIGRGLMPSPQLLMLDEPSLGLAPKQVDEIFQFIINIAREGVTILLVGQNVNYTLQISTYAYVMEVGKIVQHGPSAALMHDENVKRAYMGVA
jgi:branched-chain amino acid transport system ATP-binding protein